MPADHMDGSEGISTKRIMHDVAIAVNAVIALNELAPELQKLEGWDCE